MVVDAQHSDLCGHVDSISMGSFSPGRTQCTCPTVSAACYLTSPQRCLSAVSFRARARSRWRSPDTRMSALDRRSHGRSQQTWDGNEMDTYADDLAELLNALDIKDAVLVGHSTGGGEVARYLGRYGSKRVAKAVLISAVPPIMVKSESNA